MARYQFGCKLTLDCTRKLRRKKSWSTVRWLNAEAGSYQWNNACGARNNREYRCHHERSRAEGLQMREPVLHGWFHPRRHTWKWVIGDRCSMALCVLFPRFLCFQTFSSPQSWMFSCVAQREREETTSSSQENLQMCWFFFLKSSRFVFSRMIGFSASQRRRCVEFSSRTWGLFPVRWSRVLLCRQRGRQALFEQTFFEVFFLREFEVFSPSHDDPVLSLFKRVRDVLLRALCTRERESHCLFRR